jgi:hypothetical protein
MLTRFVKPSTLGVVLVLTATLALLSRGTGTNAAGQVGVPFGIEQLQAQLTALQARVEALRPRKFYLTVDGFDGASAATACAAGFHMASLWEIYDPTGLRYDRTLGFAQDDNGQGPVSTFPGWVRTGKGAQVSGSPGGANCNAYTSGDAAHDGSNAALQNNWQDLATTTQWLTFTASCDNPFKVWCVQD